MFVKFKIEKHKISKIFSIFLSEFFLLKKLHNLRLHHGFFFFFFPNLWYEKFGELFPSLKREIFVKFTTQKQKISKISQLFVINFFN
jgi:hypothetical protein